MKIIQPSSLLVTLRVIRRIDHHRGYFVQAEILTGWALGTPDQVMRDWNRKTKLKIPSNTIVCQTCDKGFFYLHAIMSYVDLLD